MTTFNMVLVASLIVAGVGYCTGQSHGEQIAREAATSTIRAALADSSQAIEARVNARYQAIAFAEKSRAAASDIHQQARTKIRVVSDTVLQVARVTDTVTVDVPREVVRLVQASDSLIAKQDTQIVLLTAQVRDLSADRDVWKHRALLDEDALKHARPARFGFKTGAIVGAGAVIALASLLR